MPQGTILPRHVYIPVQILTPPSTPPASHPDDLEAAASSTSHSDATPSETTRLIPKNEESEVASLESITHIMNQRFLPVTVHPGSGPTMSNFDALIIATLFSAICYAIVVYYWLQNGTCKDEGIFKKAMDYVCCIVSVGLLSALSTLVVLCFWEDFLKAGRKGVAGCFLVLALVFSLPLVGAVVLVGRDVFTDSCGGM